MGITGNRRNTHESQRIDNSVSLIEDFADEVLDNREADMAVKNSPVRSRKLKKSRFYKCILDRTVRAKKKGARQARRVENTNYLLCQSEQDDPEDPDVEYVELMEHSLTPFGALFAEEENMQIWNDFINQSEDDQREMLQKFSFKTCGMDLSVDQTDLSEGQDSSSSWDDHHDSRKLHPAYSPEQCFQRIDHRIRSLLRRRNLPLGTLMDLEEDLCSFFTEWPHSVYLCQLENGFERMLLHALCQYLRLHSSSFNNKAGSRQTQVENLNSQFILPTMTLCDYIEVRDSK